MPVLPESKCEPEGTVDAVTELCVCECRWKSICVYICICGALPMCASVCGRVHLCLHVASSPLSTEGGVGLTLLRRITLFQQIAFVPRLVYTK